MPKTDLTFRETDLKETARQFLQKAEGFHHFAFYGQMGAGKTTFITAVCKILGTSDLVTSPSFAIVNEYAAAGGRPIYHFDFYRIKSSAELMDIGFYDYCDEDSYCFIEWPEKAEEIIPDDFIKVYLKVNSDGSRSLSLVL